MAAKLKVFIGSSKEGLQIAQAVFNCLSDKELQPNSEIVIEPVIWNHYMFEPGHYILESLEKMRSEFDFVVMVASPDDILIKRDSASITMRDNVTFELGLFIGALGRERVFLVCPDDSRIDLLSDLQGFTYLTYCHSKISNDLSGNLSAVQTACLQINDTVEKRLRKWRSSEALQGKWYLYISGSKTDQPNGEFTFEQWGSKVFGESHLILNSEREEIDREYRYEGVFGDPLVNLVFEEVGRGHLRGVTALQIPGNRNEVRGRTVYWHIDEHGGWKRLDFTLKRQ